MKDLDVKENVFGFLFDTLFPSDLSNPTNENSKERCDIANERYVVKAAKELRKYEYLGYQLFRTPFNQLIERTPCLAYKIYKKNVQGISSQCRFVFSFS